MPHTELIARYLRGADELKAKLATVPAEAMDFRPAPGKWTIKQIVGHLNDTETHLTLRSRYAVAEPGFRVTLFDHNGWVDHLQTDLVSVELNVELFSILRKWEAAWLSSLGDAAWFASIEHPERGTMTVRQIVEMLAGHVDAHLAQIDRNLAAFAKTTSPSEPLG
jgi:hypothetical protein